MNKHRSFFELPNIKKEIIPVASGIPFGFSTVYNPALGIGGVYGAWGDSYDNHSLRDLVAQRYGEPLDDEDIMNLAELGFLSRHHIPPLDKPEDIELEMQIGTRMLQEAARANGWQVGEVDAVLIGAGGPVIPDYVEQICRRAGIPETALKVSVHKACDSSVAGLHLALNPALTRQGHINIAEELLGKKVLVGGIEGLSRFTSHSHDKYALQLFANAAGVIGVIPGETFKFLVGRNHEAFDGEGVLAIHMYYPHPGKNVGDSLIEVTQENPSHIRVAGLMHEPKDGSPISMAGPMGMVKLFVRTGVKVVTEVFYEYAELMKKLGTPEKQIAVGIVHHANYKINQLKAKQLQSAGIEFPMPWLLSDFGNVSAASNMIAFLRQLPNIKPGDNVLFDGFGAGTYYDVLAVTLG
ncbi:MAG TPA: 3-oxoacyl-[acyl-carrier-protein] synthase III C-terminal domain-containing protein [Anaerolineales bacterium]|nr:3-oxoacyl-[acyl-carrier-protein] synthase III C-terminal domain-containing protein [Anaerolineales bacterium]HMV96463.1 3-oxoacyl-[acyl-carrier-protein] synthase III C-terminal domain-containing protein [Anaerolineales bacterium]HMX18379.1 3-oxoacyl-[acyl-carrier-protein] synthase III C-terminal domain-containing protein [Anaerolineales bacterium]HMX73181.1 3-oxoacyl-[acyl-carrier-protein] synthase III C-terminal domain-containing protein [Anaerolineales bacterium]HMZ41584.1 3-oxoacyl-[acyl-